LTGFWVRETKNRIFKSHPRERAIPFGVALLTAALTFAFAIQLSAEPQRLEKVAPGDCAACHAQGNGLPPAHIKTDKMDWAQCKNCHKAEAGKAEKPAILWGILPLGHIHLLSGISCTDCHGMARPAQPPETPKCLSCHSDYRNAALQVNKTLPHPHDSHMGDLDCELCHHQHLKSENFCSQCHWWKYLVP
jgi:hypothetical protein